MAKKSMIEREKKRQQLVKKFFEKRKKAVQAFFSASGFEQKLETHKQIQKLPKNSSKIRLRNRCWRTGRSRGYYRDFGLCRHMIRQMIHQCILPGMKKASW